MPRYLVQRTFDTELDIRDAEARRSIVEHNADHGVTWVHSYVAEDGRTTFCVYDAPSPEAIRSTAVRNGLPVDHIDQVTVLDPYVFEPTG